MNTTPINHSLCGVLIYEPRYGDEELSDSVPLTYDSDSRKFTIESNESTLIDTVVPYSVIVTLEEYPINTYPNAPEEENGANILFGNPCDSPTFTASV